MKIFQMHKIIIIFLLFAYHNCFSWSSKEAPKNRVEIPPGVDSLIYVAADSMANQLFVSHKKMIEAENLTNNAKNYLQLADSLWTQIVIEEANVNRDSVNKIMNKAAKSYLLQRITQDSLERKIIREFIKVLIEETIFILRQSEDINRFNLQTISWLANAYKSLGDKFDTKTSYHRAIDILTHLISIIKNEHTV